MITINQLPQENLHLIFAMVYQSGCLQDFVSLSQVCFRWYNMSNDNTLWKILYYNEFHVVIASPMAKLQFKNMKALCSEFKGKLFNINPQGMNALHLSAQNRWNGETMIHTLLEHGMNPIETTYGGKTALHIAVEYHNKVAIPILTSHQEKLTQIADYQGRTPLHIAAGSGNVDICILLLKAGAPAVCLDTQKQTPLHYAAKKGHIHVCRLLAPMYGRHFIELGDSNGYTALLLAAMMNRQDCMKVLIQEFYANLNASDLQGRTIMDSVTRLMDPIAIKWAQEHQIWANSEPILHYNSREEHKEWDRIAVRDQKRTFSIANTNLFIHYK